MNALRDLAADLTNLLFASRAKRKLALLRPHKTGSKSFRTALSQSYRRSQCSMAEYSTTVSAEALKQTSFISPHLALAQWDGIEGSHDWIVAVPLREPRARLRSAFRYFKAKRGSNPLQVGELLADLSYSDFLVSKHPVLTGLKDNILTRFLGGGEFGLETETRNQLYLPAGHTMDKAEDAALNAIQSVRIYPLILEQPERSLAPLCTALGISRIPALGWQNRTQPGISIALLGEVLSLEAPLIERDLRVYEAAIKSLDPSS